MSFLFNLTMGSYMCLQGNYGDAFSYVWSSNSIVALLAGGAHGVAKDAQQAGLYFTAAITAKMIANSVKEDCIPNQLKEGMKPINKWQQVAPYAGCMVAYVDNDTGQNFSFSPYCPNLKFGYINPEYVQWKKIISQEAIQTAVHYNIAKFENPLSKLFDACDPEKIHLKKALPKQVLVQVSTEVKELPNNTA